MGISNYRPVKLLLVGHKVALKVEGVLFQSKLSHAACRSVSAGTLPVEIGKNWKKRHRSGDWAKVTHHVFGDL